MGLLDQLAGDVLGSLAGGQGQPQAAGGGQAMLLQLVMGLLQGNQGGLGALLARLNEAGLGEQVASWIGNGQNLPVSAEQISQAFGGAGLGDMAALLGMSGDQLAGNNGLSIALDDLDQHAGTRGRDFQHNLVGLDIDQDFIARNSFADFLLPGSQRAFGDGLGQLGNLNFDNAHDDSTLR